MSFFIAILLSIAIELGVKSIESWRRYDWFAQLTDWILHRLESTGFKDGPIAVLAIIAPVVIGVWIVSALLYGIGGFLGFIFGVIVLSMTLGPRDPIRQARDYASYVQQGDTEAANSLASEFLSGRIGETPAQTVQLIKRHLFERLCSNILGVFFWFIVLGPVGAALFRASCLLQERYKESDTGLSHSVTELFRILMWIPARLTVLSFAIVGNFMDVLHAIRHFADFWQRDSSDLLADAGVGALHERAVNESEPDVEGFVDAVSLARRTVLAWITFFALVVIASWIV